MSVPPNPGTPPSPLLVRPFGRLVDDASALLPEVPGGLHGVTSAYVGRARSEQGALLVRDTDLPLLRGFPGPLAVVLTGGAGQVAGPVALCRRLGLDLRRLHVALRDPGDLVGNARRVCAAVDAARSDGALDDGVAVHVEVPDDHAVLGPGGDPSASWLAAVDELAAADLGLAVPLTRPWTGAGTNGRGPGAEPVPAARSVAAIDAALDREVPLWFLGAAGLVTGSAGVPGGVGAGVLNAVLAARLVHDGELDEAVAAMGETDATALLARTDPASLFRVRPWCTAVAAPDSDRVLRDLDGLLAAGALPDEWQDWKDHVDWQHGDSGVDGDGRAL